MKLKEINRTAVEAWSPAQHHPIYLATGTSAQQLDATFSTNASLEIFELDLAEPSLAMKSCGVFSSPHRYHKLVWGPQGTSAQSHPSGVLIAGGETGNIILYDPAKIIEGDSEVVIAQCDKHTGPVRALDVNLFQANLVASGGNESEIYIWDLNSFGSPMTPGPKTQPLEDISCVAWNCQVQHILASASPSGRASIWDLRKNELIIKVSDHSNRMHCSGLAWNPEVATQLALASEDDRMPVIQMWDLRFATSPLRVLENHTKGVLAIAWSLADPELLLSCGKDNRILCWNPNTAEVLYELPTSSQWCFDIQWCPRNPAVLSAASFDGRISIYSVMGGSNDAAISAQADQISSSFGNMDPFGTGQTLPPLQLPQVNTANSTFTPLKKPPKWIRRPVGASFAFGGKLLSFENIKPPPQQPQQPVPHVVHVSQVVTETEFLERSNQLQATLNAGTFVEFCQTKIEASQNEFEKTIWAFLKIHFEDDARGKYLELLGYRKEELAVKIASALETKDCKSDKGTEPSSTPQVDHASASTCDFGPGPEIAPTQELEPPAVAQFGLRSTVHGEVANQPLVELNLEAVKEPFLNDMLDAGSNHVQVITAEAKPGLQPLVALAPSPELAFSLPHPAEPPTGITQPVLEVMSQDQPDPLPLFANSGALQPSEFDLASPDLEALLQSTPVMIPQDSEANNLKPMVVSSFISDDYPVLSKTSVVEHLMDQPQSITMLAPLAGPQESVPMLASPVDPHQSLPSADSAPQADILPKLASPLSFQPVPGFLPQLDPQAVSKFSPPTTAQQAAPEIDFTPVVESDSTPESELAPPINGGPETAPELSAVPLNDEEIRNVALIPVSQEEEAELEEVEKNGPAEEEEAPAAGECLELEEIPVGEEDAVADQIPVLEETLSQSSETVKASHGATNIDGLITQALLIGDFESAVNLCLHDNRMADSIILAIAGGPELLEKTQKKYLAKSQSKIGKLISAVVMKDWLDILETCDLQNWKEALAAVMTYAKPEEFSSLCGLLGSRLEAAEDVALQAQACLCYICAGSMEQLLSCWSKAQDSSSPLSLQDLVEKVVVLRNAVEKAQGGVAPAVGALLAEKMSQYANLLASQGSLLTAISYLPTNTEEVAVQLLRERLSKALGQQAVAPVAAAAAAAPTALRQPQPYAPMQTQPQQPPPHPAPAAPVPAPAPTHQYYPQGRAASTVTSWSNQTPTALPSVPRPLNPATDLQSEPTPGSFGGLQSPVSAGPPGPGGFMYPQQYQNPQVQQFTPGAGGPSLYQPNQIEYQPNQYSTSGAPTLPPPPSSSAPAHFYHPRYMHPASSQPGPPLFPGPPPAAAPPSLSSPVSSSFSPPSFTSGVSFQHGGPGSPTSYLPPPPIGASGTQAEPPLIPASQRSGGITQDTWFLEGPQNGWNDPPALNRVPKKKKIQGNYTPPAPITAPIMAPLGDPQQTAMQPPQQQQQQQQPHPSQPVGFPGSVNIVQQPLGPVSRNPAMPNMAAEAAPGAPIGDIIQPMQSLPAEKITKKPIPDEHLVLKTTFEALIQKCLAAATDPQTKRKLDDANKRLEYLYDKLREQTLSPAIVSGLHNMAQSIEARAYTDSLNIHTHIVSNSNFSETSAFMPVLKVVLTQANKLGV
ncbi:protein transport protein Sec31A isoform X12 [Hoplias malabaricus]|uniref:protein transport protein Sec31A isoform X12 n=1 Tax=Hoplias malabaricus TaxID=27720 RepID=UPI003461FAB3